MRALLFLIPCFCFTAELTPAYTKLKHREYKGVGYDQGYTTIDLHLSFLDSQSFTFFFNPRGHVFNDGRFAFNAGLGGRYIPSNDAWTLGLNVYYDFRSANIISPQQLGAGLEFFVSDYVFRFNGYRPFGVIKQTTPSHAAVALANIQGEVETTLLKGEIYNFSGAIGAYYLTGRSYQDRIFGKAWGSDLRLSLLLWDHVELLFETTYDHIFNFTFQGMLSLTVPFGNEKRGGSFPANLYRSVNRNEIIPIEKKTL